MDNFLIRWNNNLCHNYYSKSEYVTDKETYDELIALIPLDAKNVLDIGCGYGYIVTELLKKGINTIGTTICEDDVNNEKHIIYNDMHNLCFEDSYFDVAIMKHILEHALSPRLALREAWRVLKNNGLLLVETPINTEGVEGGDGNRSHFYCFTSKQYRNLLECNGFKIKNTGYYGSSYRIIAYKGVQRWS